MYIEIPILNSLKFIPQKDVLPNALANTMSLGGFDPNLNTTPFDENFFFRHIQKYQDEVKYFQEYQFGDSVGIHWLSDTFIDSTSVLRLLDCHGNFVKNIPFTYQNAVAGTNSFHAYLDLYNISEGTYFVQIGGTISALAYYALSEPFKVKEKCENTLLWKCTNSYNAQDVLFEQTDIEFSMRLPSSITELQPSSKFETYEDQPLNQVLLSGQAYREWLALIGGNNEAVPEFIADKIERFLLCDSLKIDNSYYTRSEESVLEPTRTKDFPLSSWQVNLRDRYNVASVTIDDLGVISLGTLPTTELFFIRRINGTPTTTVEEKFSGVNNFCGYMNTSYKREHGLKGFFSINEINELVYKPFDATDKTDFTTLNPSFNGLLDHCMIVGLGQADTLTFNYSNISNKVSVIWSDGTKSVNVSGIQTLATDEGLTYFFYDALTDIDISSAGSSVNYLGGEIGTSMTQLVCSGESLLSVGNSLFLQDVGAFDTLDLSANKLPVAEIDKIIIMLQHALSQYKISNSGIADINLQSPLAPPNGAKSFRALLSILKQNWTINHD